MGAKHTLDYSVLYFMPTQVLERCILCTEKLKVGSSSSADSSCNQVALSAPRKTVDSSVRKRGEGRSARDKRERASRERAIATATAIIRAQDATRRVAEEPGRQPSRCTNQHLAS